MTKRGRSKRGPSRKRQQGRRPPAPRQAAATRQAPAQKTATPPAEIQTLREEAETDATAEDKAVLTTEPRPDGMDLDGMWKMASEARDLFKAQEARHSELASKLEAQRERLAEEKADVAKRASELDEQASRLDEDKASVDDRTRRLGEQEIAVREREGQLEEEARRLDRRERKIRWDEEDIEEQQADLEKRLEDRVDRRVAARREKYESELAAVTAERDQARADRDRGAEELARREDTDRRFGQRSPDEFVKELDALRAENQSLRDELAERPDAAATQRIDDLIREQQSWQAERADLTRQVAELKRRLAYADNDLGEREAQRDRIASLVSQGALLHKANEELRAEVGELVDKAESQSPFPACIEMDEGQDLQRAGQTGSFGSLQELAEHVRDHMASGDQPLYYSEADVRSFIAGLAMGRLILLQGISGTGKTSLPIAFASAVGTEASVIEVQAGWRDPQDLVGHYNSFEKRFHEKEFLKALYRAGTPRWRDTIQIVLLDEMNLSYPEQYFSDMLSALERPGQQQLELMPHAVASPPSRFEGGSKLPIPPNIWFVGTANHDETTMNFADKTYDRAHVMEFPHLPQVFDVAPPEARHPVPFNAFEQAVKSAVQAHAPATGQIWAYLEDNLRVRLAKDFDIGWGPRLKRQMERYVPVVIETGGTPGEAADQLLAMRLLRKLKDRHSTRPEHLEVLKGAIEESWFDRKAQPTKSIRLLDGELARMGHDVDREA